MASFKFKVDSALLRELGERLVGKPHIALAELVKNSFDADAMDVIVRLGDDWIEVEDNGHGMTKEEFDGFWMRIGSIHKSREGVSRKFRRPLTGSKGVGRLAGQLLAKKMAIFTTSETDTERVLVGAIDWERAVQHEDLTEARVGYLTKVRNNRYVGNSKHGTRIRLHGLNQIWTPKAISDLAREIWWLTPPFRTNRNLRTDEQKTFNVRFEAEDRETREAFTQLMRGIFDLWYAKLVGRLISVTEAGIGEVELALEWKDGETRRVRYEVEDCELHEVEFEILVYHLQQRQARGISVRQAREYLNDHGNVHIYDGGFHLPYYGPKVDWLRVEFDHAHRLSTSKLLPKELQFSRGMNYLPTQSRLLGVVNVNTGAEQRAARSTDDSQTNHLAIQISRDRLIENAAFRALTRLVRWSLDYYAMEEARRAFREKEARKDTAPAREKFVHVEEVLEKFEDRIEASAMRELRENIEVAVVTAEEESRKLERHAGLLGALATAGISALAFQHEHQKQLSILEYIVRELRSIGARHSELADEMEVVAAKLEIWLDQTRATFALFQSLSNKDNREVRARLKALETIREVVRQMAPLLRGAEVDLNTIESDMRLPRGTFAEWSSIFQNALVNAANAMLDSKEQRIRISSQRSGLQRSIIFEDTGSGVDLDHSDELFDPFVRKLEISRERQALGYGGMGLGLTIVRMVAEALECSVSFVKPSAAFRTALRITWHEKS
ncbi:MAG: ATP-binding protein [Candidatus Pacebacteria bacterium]|nr:ATP-binding protein [Candidatus Paceibacterota bacterium]